MRSGIASLVVVLGASLLPCLSFAQTYSKTETIEYSDNLTSWVLGQVKRTTTNGTEVSRTDYDPTTALPTATYSFGKLEQTVTYNADGTVATVADGNSNVTHLSNYKLGIPQRIDFPATLDQPSGTSISADVNDLGEILSVVDANGAKTCYGYDPMGRVNLIQYPSETTLGQCGGSWNQTQMSFSSNYPAADGLPAGQWRQRVITGNSMTETLFDSLWRPVVKQTYDMSNVNATISQVVTRYDANGRVAFVSYPQRTVDSSITNTWADLTQTPNALGTTTAYDALDRVTSVTRDAEAGVQDVTTTRYLPDFETEVTDPNHNVTTTAYLTYDEPTTEWPVQVDAPEGVTQIISRDAYGKPRTITQSGLYNGTETDTVTKTLVYDIYERLCRTNEPESGDTVIFYDGANNIQHTAAGLAIPSSASACGREVVPTAAETTFTYDAMNRLKTVEPPVGTQSTSYNYSPAGDVTWANSGNAIWENHYNSRRLLTSETLHLVGQDDRTLGYSYDAYGHLSQLTYPGGETVNYAPDALGRPTQVGNYASGIGYFPNGQVKQFTYGNGTSYVASQNTRQLLSNFSYGSAAGALNLSEDLHYDPDANITSVDDLVNGQRSKSFQYDGLNRLTQAVASGLWGTESYRYDALNNLRVRVSGGQTATYNYDPSKTLLVSISGGLTPASFVYDTRGNEINKNGVALQFDAKNQLTQITGVDNYQYDASGRRVQKTSASGVSTYPLYNHAGQLLYQYAPGLAASTNFIYLGTRAIARHQSLQLTAPNAVSFDSNPNNGNYTVSWGAVPGATSYNLQESANGGAWSTVYTGSATSAAMSDKPGGSYVYQAQGCAQGTCGAWTGSETLGVRPPLPTVSGPTTLVFGTYTVSWSGASGATAYDVQESFNGGAWSTIASAITASSLSVSRPNGGTYAYQVQASNMWGSRGWSAPATVSVTQVPATPTNFAFGTDSNGNAVLTWDAMPWATTYQLTVYGTNGNVGTYTYTVGQPSFNVPAGNYKVEQLAACSIAGCSAPAQVSGGGYLGNTAASGSGSMKAGRRRQANTPPATSGCSATRCSAVIGGTP